MADIPTFAEPEDAYFEFFRADSAKEPMGWANVMSYPHVRVSARGRAALYPTRQDYAAAADWSGREATGWVRSEGIPPVRLHESPNKVHLLGGWTRFNKDDEPILENRVTYILTKPADSWGIQARFGTDSWPGTDDDAAGSEASAELARLYAELTAVPERAAERCIYPMTVVEVGAVRQLADAGEFVAAHSGGEAVEWTASEIKAVQAGSRGVVVSAMLNGPSVGKGLFLLGRTDQGWKLAGTSLIR